MWTVARALVVLALVFAHQAKAADTEWVVRSWETGDGLPQNTVNAIAQTRDGFLWVGTSGGLARFDGVRFRSFGLQEGLRAVRISTLVEDKRGALWIGTTGGGVSRMHNGQLTTFRAAEGFPDGADVVSMCAGRDSSVWIGTSQGLLRWKDGAFSPVGEAQGLPQDQVRALVEDEQGTLWVSALDKGLYRGTNGHFTRVDEAGPAVTYCLAKDRDGAIWAADGNGHLWRWREGAWQHFDPSAGFPETRITALSSGGDGTLWICTADRGLYRSSGDGFVPALPARELPDPGTRAVAVDRDGSIWVGTFTGGLSRLAPRVLQYHSAGAEHSPSSFNSIAEDETGAWWTGAGAQGLYRFEGGRFSKVDDPAISEAHHIYSVIAAGDGGLWAAGEQCLYRFQAGQPTQVFRDPPVGGEAIRALCADGRTLWLGTYYSTLLRCDAAGVRVVAPRGTFHGDITSIVCEAGETLWVGSAGGVHRWEQGKIARTWDTRDGLLTASVRALSRDPDGTLWIGTQGGGLARLKGGRIFNFTTRQGLADDIISQIAADDYGCLWLGCNRGLMRLERRELHDLADGKATELHPVTFGRNEGLLKEQCTGGHSPTAIKTRAGHLLFPMAAGIAELDPQHLEAIKGSAPEPGIDSIVVDGQPCSREGGCVIPPGHHLIDIAFTAPVLRGGEWVRFRQRLEGFDPDWRSAGRRRLSTYDGLAPGRYVFHVAAADGSGDWHESPTSLAFTIQPFFWQSPWFRAAGVILLVAGSSAGVWWQQHLRHERRLAQLDRERRKHAEVVHAGRVTLLGELSASIAHELKQPLAAILTNAQAGQRFLDDPTADPHEVREILRDIVSDDRRAGEIITRLQTLVKKGERQLEPRDLNADIEQALLLLRSELATRRVTVETRLAPDLPPVSGDHIQLQQILLNLLVNASDAMHAQPPDERRIVVAAARDPDGAVRVSVTDRGPGIPPDALARIFEPFFSTKQTGLGMGLAICQAIIKSHGGRLWAENRAGGGAAFHFTLVPEQEK